MSWTSRWRPSASDLAALLVICFAWAAPAHAQVPVRSVGPMPWTIGTTTRGQQAAPVGEAPEERPADEIFLRGQRVLLGRGDVVVDVGQFYARSDDYVLASTDNAIGLATFRQELLTTLLQARVGIFDETEVFAGVTFQHRRDRVLLGDTELAGSSRNDYGGTTIGVRRTLLKEGPGRPSLIATLSGRIPSGDRPYVAGGGLAIVKSIDPVALFANVHYARLVARTSTGVSSRSVDSLLVSAGYALALNDTLAVSTAVSGVFNGTATAFDDTRVGTPGSFALRAGLTSWLARGLYIEPSVSFTLTGPGRSVAFGVSLPYAF